MASPLAQMRGGVRLFDVRLTYLDDQLLLCHGKIPLPFSTGKEQYPPPPPSQEKKTVITQKNLDNYYTFHLIFTNETIVGVSRGLGVPSVACLWLQMKIGLRIRLRCHKILEFKRGPGQPNHTGPVLIVPTQPEVILIVNLRQGGVEKLRLGRREDVGQIAAAGLANSGGHPPLLVVVFEQILMAVPREAVVEFVAAFLESLRRQGGQVADGCGSCTRHGG